MEIAEPTITCPYNKAHSIISSRMQFHLSKCRLQYPNAEKAVCPFNSTHIVNKVELEYHQMICGDRIVLDSFTYKIGNSNPLKVGIAKVEPIEIRGDECWDDDIIDVSVLDRVHESSKNKPTLQALIGAPKSERKAFRNQERLRIQRVLDNQMAENNNSAGGKGKKKLPQGAAKGSEIVKGKVEDIDEKNGRHISKMSYNGAVTTPQSQSITTESGFGAIHKPSGGAYREPQNPWHSNKSLPNNGIENLKETRNIIKTNVKDVKYDATAITNSLGNLNIRPNGPVGPSRDPGNPWGSYKLPSSMMTSTADQSDFPMLPVTSRGRGRDRLAAIRSK